VLGLCRDHDVRHSERDLSLAEVYRADEVFCTGTMGELAAVVQLDGRAIGDGGVGPTTRRLGNLYAELTATAGEPVV
jgi:branched-chain amino acid aminotransferase